MYRSIIIDQLTKEQANKHVAYFYCDFRDIEKTKPVNLYGSLLAQILDLNFNELPEDIAAYHQKNKSRNPYEFELRDMLMHTLAIVPATTIVIDALDECQNRQDLLEGLLDLHKSYDQVRLLVTSREESDIKQVFSGVTQLWIQAEMTASDIALFVEEEVEHQPKLKRLKPATKTEIIKTITAEAKGMFRWAKCSIDHIARLRTDRDIKNALKSLPPGLDEMYERILMNITDVDKETTIRLRQLQSR